jgi:tetratricopeptide (TPR) repeat protein
MALTGRRTMKITDYDDAYGLLCRGNALLEGGEPEEAAFLLEMARRSQPHKGSILESLGRAYFSAGRYGAAASVFEEATDVDPVNDYAHYCLGLSYLKLSRKREAAGMFKLAWALRPLDIYRAMASRFGAEGAG